MRERREGLSFITHTITHTGAGFQLCPGHGSGEATRNMGTIEITPEALEALRLFNQYCYPKSHFWKNQPSKQAALDMLGSGIFGDNVLRGHARHKTTYPVILEALIYELVNLYREYAYAPPISYIKEDIVGTFDHHFSYVFGIAQFAVKEKEIEGCWVAWREQISKAVDDGKISPDWRRLMEEKIFEGRRYRPKKLAYRFADVFLSYCLLAPYLRIALWVNAILKSLGLDPFNKSSLCDYVKLKQKKEKDRITEAGGDYHNYQRHLQIQF
jgi:hypothetical protein